MPDKNPETPAEPEKVDGPPSGARPRKGKRAKADKRTGHQLADALKRAAGEEPDEAIAVEPQSSGGPSADVPDKLYFRIGEVAQLVAVDAHVLRYWESEFRMKPHRSPSGQRLYRKQDLSRFLRIKTLLHEEGYTIAGARRVLAGGKSQASADPARIRTALDKVRGLRGRIREIQDDLELSKF